ncbi:MAG: SGNH/GDSL hydrolase family protein [Verrucomicrobiota bacterium]|jgi:lysophospholipase L1-like esterase
MTQTQWKRAFGLGVAGGFSVAMAAALVMFWPAQRQNPWELEIREFELADQTNAPPKNGILFVGSSTVRLWHTLQQDFPGYRIVKRGFGGSQIEDVMTFLDRIVLPYEPRMILLYAGDNDLAAGKTPEEVVKDFEEFVAEIHKELPKTRIGFISVKPSLARWHLLKKVRKTNRLIQELTQKDPLVTYIDVFTPMLDEKGRLKTIYLADDGLHLSPKGYALWTAIIRTNLPPKLPGVSTAQRPPLK